MAGIRLRLQRHVLAPGVEEPDEGGVVLEGLGGRQRRGLVIAPETAIAAEGRQARGDGQSGAAEGEDAIARSDELAELGDRGSGLHGFPCVVRMASPEASARIVAYSMGKERGPDARSRDTQHRMDI